MEKARHPATGADGASAAGAADGTDAAGAAGATGAASPAGGSGPQPPPAPSAAPVAGPVLRAPPAPPAPQRPRSLGRDPHPWGASALGKLSLRRRAKSWLGRGVMGLAASTSFAALAFMLFLMVREGAGVIDLEFLTSYPSRLAAKAGIKAAIVGTAWVGIASMAVALPIGIMAAIYLNEFASHGRVTTLLRAGIANLAGVPSIVFGILGLALFVRAMALGSSIVAAGFTLGLLTLPIVIVVSEEALKSVPMAIREAAFGLGASRWQVVRHHVLPYALPGMLTGSILALSRTMGETAPLIVIGAAVYIDFLPQGPMDRYTALPIQTFFWAEKPQEAFHELAWGAVLVLIAMVLLGNLAAILLRDRFQRRYRW